MVQCQCKKDSTGKNWDSFVPELNSGRQVLATYKGNDMYCISCGNFERD